METLLARPVRAGQTLPQGGSGAAALRGPKKPTPVCNTPDMPTSVWSEMARSMRNRKLKSGKQMTTDASRLMRPEAGAPQDAAGYGRTTVLPSGLTVSSSARGSADIIKLAL
jgi:hypothetical protein